MASQPDIVRRIRVWGILRSNPRPGRQVDTPEGARRYRPLTIGMDIPPGWRALTPAQIKAVEGLSPEGQRRYDAARLANKGSHAAAMKAAGAGPAPRKAAAKPSAPAKRAPGFDAAEVAGRVASQKTEADVIRLLSGDSTLTAAKLRKVAEHLGIDVPDNVRAKTSLQLLIAESEATERDLPSGFDADATPAKATKRTPAKAGPSRRAGITPDEYAQRYDKAIQAGLTNVEAAKYARSDFDSPRAWKAAHTPAKTAPKKLTPGQIVDLDEAGLVKAVDEGTVSRPAAARRIREFAQRLEAEAVIGRRRRIQSGVAGGESYGDTPESVAADAEAARLNALADKIEAKPPRATPAKKVAVPAPVKAAKKAATKPEQIPVWEERYLMGVEQAGGQVGLGALNQNTIPAHNSLVRRGYLEHVPAGGGYRLTDAGREYLVAHGISHEQIAKASLGQPAGMDPGVGWATVDRWIEAAEADAAAVATTSTNPVTLQGARERAQRHADRARRMRELRDRLSALGWVPISTSGSNGGTVEFRSPDGSRRVGVPFGGEMSEKTAANLLKIIDAPPTSPAKKATARKTTQTQLRLPGVPKAPAEPRLTSNADFEPWTPGSRVTYEGRDYFVWSLGPGGTVWLVPVDRQPGDPGAISVYPPTGPSGRRGMRRARTYELMLERHIARSGVARSGTAYDAAIWAAIQYVNRTARAEV